MANLTYDATPGTVAGPVAGRNATQDDTGGEAKGFQIAAQALDDKATSMMAADARIAARADILEEERVKTQYSQIITETNAYAATLDPLSPETGPMISQFRGDKLGQLMNDSSISGEGYPSLVAGIGSMTRSSDKTLGTDLLSRQNKMVLGLADQQGEVNIGMILEDPNLLYQSLAAIDFSIGRLMETGNVPELAQKRLEQYETAHLAAYDTYKLTDNFGAMNQLLHSSSFENYVDPMKRLELELDISSKFKDATKNMSALDQSMEFAMIMTNTEIPDDQKTWLKKSHLGPDAVGRAPTRFQEYLDNFGVDENGVKLPDTEREAVFMSLYGTRDRSSVVGEDAGINDGLQAVAEYRTVLGIPKDQKLSDEQRQGLVDFMFTRAKGGTSGDDAGDELADKFLTAIAKIRKVPVDQLTDADIERVADKILGAKPGDKDRKHVLDVLTAMYPRDSAEEIKSREMLLDEDTRERYLGISATPKKLEPTKIDRAQQRIASLVGADPSDPAFEQFFAGISETMLGQTTNQDAHNLYMQFNNGIAAVGATRTRINQLYPVGAPETISVSQAKQQMQKLAPSILLNPTDPGLVAQFTSLLNTAFPAESHSTPVGLETIRAGIPLYLREIIANTDVELLTPTTVTTDKPAYNYELLDASNAITPDTVAAGLYMNAALISGAGSKIGLWASRRPAGAFSSAEEEQALMAATRDHLKRQVMQVTRGQTGTRIKAEYEEFAAIVNEFDTAIWQNTDSMQATMRGWDKRLRMIEKQTLAAINRGLTTTADQDAKLILDQVRAIQVTLSVPDRVNLDRPKDVQKYLEFAEAGDVFETRDRNGKLTIIELTSEMLTNMRGLAYADEED